MVAKKERILFLDILNIVAIISVIALHMNGIVHTYSEGRSWATSLIVECLCYFAVPIFFMVSGANLLNYRDKYDTKTFFKKRFTKVLVPSIFWIIIMILWKSSLNQIEFKNASELLDAIFNNKVEYTYYFIWEILGIYLTLPIISKIIYNKGKVDNRILWYFVITFFIFNSFLPYIFSLFSINYNLAFSIRIGEYYIFVVLGYLLLNTDIKKKHRIILYILGILCIIFRYTMTYFLSHKYGMLDRSTWGYTQFHSIILACVVFVFFKYLNLNKIKNNEKICHIIQRVSSCSFGIYLIHLIVKYYETELFSLNIYSWKYRTIGIISTYLISLLIIMILKKIPIIKKIVA